jgi:hypothetical protein
MERELRNRLIYTAIAFLVLLGARIAWLAYERRDTGVVPVRQETYTGNPDDYVKTHKIFAYDLKSAQKEMVGQPMWVRAGNQIPYYHYTPAAHSVNFQKRAGLLAPIEKLTVDDVILQKAPAKLTPGQVAVVSKQIMIVFKRDGDTNSYAASIGTNVGDDYTFTVNEILFSQDPHEMYKHWPPDIWGAIEQHQVKEGMNELQSEFALGTDMSTGPGDYGDRVVEFYNLGKPVQVTFAKNKAIKVEQVPTK